MTLLEFFNNVYVLHRSIAPNTEQTIERSCRQFLDFLGESPPLAEITADDISRWVRHMQAKGLSPYTIRSKRGDVVCVLNLAVERELREPLRKVRSVRLPHPTPKAWTLEEFGRIMRACQSIRGHMLDGTPRREYWSALVSAAYDSGLRRTDLLAIRSSEIDDSGRYWVPMNKTGHAVCSRFRPITVKLIRSLAQRRGDRVFAIPGKNGREGHRNQLIKWWPKIRKMAGIADGGAFYRVRKTGATHVEKHQPGAAKAYLGHATESMVRFYVDRRIAGDDPPLPPQWGDCA